MRESSDLEFKESVTSTFLKTVSAYANYGTGRIVFGVRDDGTVCGVPELSQTCLDIENRINDSIDPIPQYALQVDERAQTITLTVYEGRYKPYLYKAKAYGRHDTATAPVDRLELTRLILEGQNMSFEEQAATASSLTFITLAAKLRAALNLQEVTQDTLKTLEIYSDTAGYNRAAELLADRNGFPGVDMTRFGDTVDVIRERRTAAGVSLLTQFDEALEMYRAHYRYEQIVGSVREPVEAVPEAAFREALANALVHRTWDVSAHITLALFPDRIECVSPGGLPRGVDEADYLRGGISILRNRIIAGVFYRLHLIEHFGTGIRRIIEAYNQSETKPRFEVTESAIRVILPVMSRADNLTNDERTVYALLRGRFVSSAEVVKATGFGKSKAVSLLKSLAEKGYARVTGVGRGTRYTAE